MKSDAKIKSINCCDTARLAQRFALSSEQTVDLILSIVTAVQAGIDGHPEVKEQLISDAEQRFSYANRIRAATLL